MRSIKNISIIGAGAVGAYFICKLYDMDPHCISAIADGERHERIKEQGLIINSKPYFFKVVKPHDHLPPSDLIIVAVKHHHLHQAIKDISNQVGPHTSILSVMNGIDSEQIIASVYGREKILYGVVVGISGIREGNNVTFSNQTKLFFGEASNVDLSDRVRRLHELFDRAGINYETPIDMIRKLWWKFMINIGINQVQAVIGTSRYAFQVFDEAKDLMVSAMREVIPVAKAAGVDLTEQDIDDWYSFLLTQSPDGKTSMLQDIEANRKTEAEMFGGKIIELGKKYGIPTPVNETLYKLVKILEKK